MLTGSRLLLGLGVAVLTPWGRENQEWAVWFGTVLVALIEVTDLADGYLARRHNAVSQFGKVFDPFSDSVSRLTVFWSLAVMGRCLVYVPLIMAVRDISVAYLRLVLIRQGGDGSARYTGKMKAAVQGACGLVLISGPLYWGQQKQVFVYAASIAVIFVCAASLTDYGMAALRGLRSQE